MEIKNKLNLDIFDKKKVISFFIMVVILAEWIPFFLQITLNFMVAKKLQIYEIVMVASVAITPIMIFLISITRTLFSIDSAKFNMIIKRITNFLIPITIFIVIILCWLYTVSYYNVFNIWTPELPDLNDIGEIVGFFASFSPLTQFAFLILNVVLFVFLIPLNYSYVTNGVNEIKFDLNLDISVFMASIYMMLRFGGIGGVPLRIGVICIILLVYWFFPSMNKTKKDESIIIEEDKIRKIPICIHNMPLFAALAIYPVIAFWIGAPGLLMNGMLYNSWTWIFLGLGILLRILLSGKYMVLWGKKYGIIGYLILCLFSLLIIIGHSIGFLIYLQPIIISIGLFSVGFFIPNNRYLFPESDLKRFNNHPIRFFFLNFIAILGYTFPFLSGVFQPYSIWVALGLHLLFVSITIVILTFKNKKLR